MALGPGKYDDILTEARRAAEADGAILIVFGGAHGDGFSVQADLSVTLALPVLLEEMARLIRRDLDENFPRA